MLDTDCIDRLKLIKACRDAELNLSEIATFVHGLDGDDPTPPHLYSICADPGVRALAGRLLQRMSLADPTNLIAALKRAGGPALWAD